MTREQMEKGKSNTARQAAELRRYFELNGMKYRDVAERIGVRPSTLSNIIAGRETIGKQRAAKMVEAFGFDYRFLLTGEGSLFPSKSSISQSANGTNIKQVAKVEGNECPSFDELKSKVEMLEQTLSAKDDEVAFLRGLINKILGTKTANDLNDPE